ncbi:DUF6344 domain-containing protein [Streptomyces purpureus]|uniref:Secreted protein n=1 Tax=Streptomyces purpureus TaxID=1951 RepID=A0A918GYD4_9ACTN|nr:DUF6344 domain-containing protein [Streptomyces purpureus]GGT21061.1 hypothetical protein GCM10014713_12450 [Streptomyces purpureus]
MAAVKVKQFWTAFVSLLVALFASVGLTGTAAPALRTPVRRPEGPTSPTAPAAPVRSKRAAAPVPAQAVYRAPMPRDRSLPPTIKQRIGAEAHGSSPSVRHLPAGPAETDPALDEPALAAV